MLILHSCLTIGLLSFFYIGQAHLTFLSRRTGEMIFQPFYVMRESPVMHKSISIVQYIAHWFWLYQICNVLHSAWNDVLRIRLRMKFRNVLLLIFHFGSSKNALICALMKIFWALEIWKFLLLFIKFMVLITVTYYNVISSCDTRLSFIEFARFFR